MELEDEGYIEYSNRLIKKLANAGEESYISKEDFLSPYFARFIENYSSYCEKYDLPKTKLFLNSSKYDDLIYSKEELKILVQNYESLKKLTNIELYLREEKIDSGTALFHDSGMNSGSRREWHWENRPEVVEHTLPEVILANKRLQNIADLINEGKGNNKPFTPFEKYCLCFILVQYDVMYNNDEAKFDKNYNPRSLISTVANMEGVCMGKSLMLQKFLSMVGVEARCIPVSLKKMSAEQQNDSPETTDHVINIVAFKDEEYGMNGLFALDVTNEKIFIPINEVFEKALVQTSFLYAFEDISSFYNYAYENFLPEYLDSQVNAQKYNDQESTMGQLFENYNFGEFVSLLANGRNLNKSNETILIDWLNKKFNEENKTFGFYTMEADNEFSDFIKKAKSCHSWKELKEFAYARKNGFEDADMTRQLKPLEEGLDSDRASLDLAYDYLYKEVKKHINTIYALNDLRWLKEMERPTEEAIERCGENIDNTLNQIRNKLNQQESHNDLELA